MESKKFTVVIVGGSIAGLTLAHGLSRIGVDYVILEKRDEITPQEGASIGILPHGGRILSQLGLFDAVEELIEPLHTAHLSYPDGFEHTNQSPDVINERFGMPLAFLERRKMLEVLYNSLPDQSRVLVKKRVVRVEDDDYMSGMVVRTQDGCFYKGDLVVGADGVHSKVRSEMWRLANLAQPGAIPENERDGMAIEYACVFGISSEVQNLNPGEQVASLNDGRSFLTFPGKGGRVFWFLLVKLDRKYPYASAPRFTTEDAQEMGERYANDHIWKGVRFGDIWNHRLFFGATNLEENVFQTWHSGRVVCIGDSIHKMAPNTGQGANCAIEDAGALANFLHQAIVSDGTLCNHEMDSLLKAFTQTRIQRIRQIYKSARLVVRLHARHNLFLRLIGRYYLPYSGDLPAGTASRMIAGAVSLNFLPLPQRSGPGWELFSRERGSVKLYFGLVLASTFLLSMLFWRKDMIPHYA